MPPSLRPLPDNLVTPLLLHHDVAPPSPAPAPTPPWDGEVSRGDRFSLDRQSPTEISSLDSTDSTLVDSPRWDDSLFLQFLRSPSPQSRTPTRENDEDNEEKSHVAPTSDMLTTSANAGKEPQDDQRISAPPEGLSKIKIRLLVKPDPPPAPPGQRLSCVVLHASDCTKGRSGVGERRSLLRKNK